MKSKVKVLPVKVSSQFPLWAALFLLFVLSIIFWQGVFSAPLYIWVARFSFLAVMVAIGNALWPDRNKIVLTSDEMIVQTGFFKKSYAKSDFQDVDVSRQAWGSVSNGLFPKPMPVLVRENIEDGVMLFFRVYGPSPGMMYKHLKDWLEN